MMPKDVFDPNSTQRKIVSMISNFSLQCRKEPSILSINCNSELSRQLITSINEIFSSGFRFFPYHRYSEFLTRDLSELSFFSVFKEELTSLQTIQFITSLSYPENDRKRGYLWILLELSNKSILTTIESLLQKEKMYTKCFFDKYFSLVCYEEGSILRQPFLIDCLETLCSLNFQIEGELFSKFCLFEGASEKPRKASEEENKEIEEVKQFHPEPEAPAVQQNQGYRIIVTPCAEKSEDNLKIVESKAVAPRYSGRLSARNIDGENKAAPQRTSWINIAAIHNQPGSLQQCRESYLMKLQSSKEQLQITMNLMQKTGKVASEILFEKVANTQQINLEQVFKEVVEGVQLKLDQVSGEEFRVGDQDFKCWACFRQITVGILGNSRFCYYTCRYHCFECLSSKRMPIPWKAILEFDLDSYKVSTESYSEIEKLYDLPILQINYNSPVVLKSTTLFEFLVQKRSLHLLYDTICDPGLLNTMLQDRINLCLKQNLFSLQNLKEVAEGSLQRTLDEILKSLLKHVDNCKKCMSKGGVCKICKSQRVVFAYDIANINYCRKCMSLYHRKCLNRQFCPSCAN